MRTYGGDVVVCANVEILQGVPHGRWKTKIIHLLTKTHLQINYHIV